MKKIENNNTTGQYAHRIKLCHGGEDMKYVQAAVLILILAFAGCDPGPFMPGNQTGMAAGQNHVCLLKQDTGAVRCWGYNTYGQVGCSGADQFDSPCAVTGIPGWVTAIGAGRAHSCAIAGGHVWCWGDNHYAQLGYPIAYETDSGRQYRYTSVQPLQVPVLNDMIAVTGGENHTCAIKSDGTVWCWGLNTDGQLGTEQFHHTINSDYDGYGSIAPLKAELSSGAQAISGGYNHTCAVVAGGSVWCWGDNREGQLGTVLPDNPHKHSPVPVKVGNLPGPAKQVSAREDSTCATLEDGSIWCWGNNQYNQIGDTGGKYNSSTPVRLWHDFSGPGGKDAPLSSMRETALGEEHGCAASTAGTIFCWGSYETAFDFSLAHAIPLSGGAMAIASQDISSCVLLDDESIWCWSYGLVDVTANFMYNLTRIE